MNTTQDTHTFTGTSLEEILPQIRAALGDDAVVVGRREVFNGGVGGFFAKRAIEVQARPARARIDITDDAPAGPEPELGSASAVSDAFAEHLARLNAAPPPPAAAVEPTVVPQVSDAPTLDDLLPEPRSGLAALFAQGAPQPVDEPEDAQVVEIDLLGGHAEPAAPQRAGGPDALDFDEPLAIVPAPPAPPAPVLPDPFARAERQELPAAAAALVEHGLSPELALAVHDEATSVMPLARTPSLEPLLRDALARRIPIASPRRGPGGAVVGFVGPGGSGKTRCIARMATAYATRSELPVAVITLRAKDGGAELQRLLGALDVPVHAEEDAAAAQSRIDALREHTLVLIDTPALSPRAEAERRVLSGELDRIAVDELHVCVPATIAPRAGRVLVEAAAELGADAMAVTHLDETDELGTVVELAIDTDLPISMLARGTSLESGLRLAAADDLALALVP